MFQRTKRFLKKSIETVKSYFSEGYEKLPKTPSYNGRHNAGFGLDNVYSEFVDQRDAGSRIMAISYEKNTNNLDHKKPSMRVNQHEADTRKERHQIKVTSSKRERDEKRGFITSKLKELENLDSKNVDYVLDIQEVLHLYSRLKCPVYCEIVEKFFMEIYSEVFSLPVRNY